jgi:GalNAc-alpha-(1->4)-GalNAc-alpha-(1->3)-diNAcBac-PP-undecaprenol alpha-1,4-N-acetyl-D-galactosaminyltransferase
MTKKICFVSGGLTGGGQERALINYANEFAKNGYEVTIICLFNTEVFFAINSKVNIVWPNIIREKYNKFIYAFKSISYIRRNINLFNPDVVISFGDWYNAYVVIATLFLSKKVYITNRMGPEKGYGHFIDLFNKISYPFASGMIVQTERAAKIMKSKFRLKKITVIENMLNPLNIENLTPGKNIIAIGRLSKEKDHRTLIEAFSKIKKNKEWTLTLVGDGAELENLKMLTKSLGLEKNIVFLGHLKDFKKEISNTSIYVLPSVFEGFPNSLIEAMSVPLACIASDCVAGPSEIINHKINGYLFEPGNSDELAKYLDELIDNEDIRNRIKAEAYKVRERYTFENSLKKFETIVIN